MSNPIEKTFLSQMYRAAIAANHKWPGAAAAEAWVETGGSHWPRNSCNVLGIMDHKGWLGPITLKDGTEQEPSGLWDAPKLDAWCVFGSFTDCFAEQMRILQHPNFTAAVAATTIEDYIREECKVWSTGILKGVSVLQTYRAHLDILAPEVRP